MDYLNNSVRKIGRFFSSPTPASTLGKRKADSDDPFPELEHTCPDGSFSNGDDTPDEDGNYYDCPIPQPPQKRIRKPATAGARTNPTALNSRADVATQRANDAMRKARESMRNGETSQVALSDEQEIQDELDRQQRQEEADRKKLHMHQRKSQTEGKSRSSQLIVPSGFAQNRGSPRPKPGPKPSAPETSGPRTALSPRFENIVLSMEQWHTEPNLRARQLLEEHGHDATAMLKDLQEPAYVCRDTEIRDGVWKMMGQIEDFAKEHFSFEIDDETRLRTAFESMEEETVKIIGCVASGGPAGARGWEDLFLVSDKRQALVCAIIGNVLVEQVFQHIFFGGTEAQMKEVAAIQFDHRHKDGFDRNTLYAEKIRSFLTSTSLKGKAPSTQPTSTLHLPPNFAAHVNHIVASIYTHVKPILHLCPKDSLFNLAAIGGILPRLYSLTTLTGLLSLQMRLDPHTVYHFTPVFKEQPFLRSDMECYNEAAMIAMHPKGEGDKDLISKAEQARRSALSATETARMKHDQGLIQIILLPGITAYRLGGWETPSSTAKQVQYEEGGKDKGVRARRLTDAWVYCRWGRPRVFQDGMPADDPAVHGVQWKDGGFVEFFPGVEGVRDPDPQRTARRQARRQARKKREEAANRRKAERRVDAEVTSEKD